MAIPKPSSLGGQREDYFYIKLDLTNYAGEINTNLINYTKNLVIWIIPQD